MKYSILDFQKEFPSDDVCFDFLFRKKYPELKGYYRVKGRKAYANAQGEHIHPLVGTIFEKSDTSLVKWFFAIYLFSQSKNGVSAKELERQLSITYKTAWRIAKQIRSLMGDGGDMLSGTIEVDETYIGGYRKGGHGGKGKTPVFGMVERGGKKVKAKVTARETHLLLNEIRGGVEKGSAIISDKFHVYTKTKKLGYTHESINHFKKELARNEIHTNTIEGFWAQLKRGLLGTYNGAVSPTYLQSYVNEFSFRYAKSSPLIFASLLAKI